MLDHKNNPPMTTATSSAFSCLLIKGTTSSNGMLVLTPTALTFNDSLSIPYESIVLHATCTDPESFPEPCLYVQTDEEDDGDDIRFVIRDEEVLQTVFRELSKQIAAHPVRGEEGEGFFDGQSMMWVEEEEEEDGRGGAAREEMLRKLDSVLVVQEEPDGEPPAKASRMMVPGQFDEVEE